MFLIGGPGSHRLRRSIRRHVEALGDRPDVIADRLSHYQVRGLPRKVSDCVLARYLQAVIGTEQEVSRVAVVYNGIHIYRSPRSLPMYVRLPKATTKFVRRFDAGCYPQLIDWRARRVQPGAASSVPFDQEVLVESGVLPAEAGGQG